MTTPTFDYPEEIQAIQNGLDGFVRAELIGRHTKHADVLSDPRKRYTEQGLLAPQAAEIIRELRMASAEAGYYTMCVPEELGGAGMGALAYFAAWEKIYHICGGEHWLSKYAISHWARGPSPVLRFLSDEIRQEVLDDLMSGRKSLCFGLSEPEAGSDAMAMTTRAEPDGDGWRLRGQKMWITNGPYADYAIIFAITNPDAAAQRKGGISGFFVPTDSEGFNIETIIKMSGSIGGDEAILILDDVRVAQSQLMGELDKGFAIAMGGVSLGRIYNMARAIGLGHWALETAIEYTRIRKTFGHPLSDYQGVMFPLAEAATDLYAGQLMAINAARLVDCGQRAPKEISMGKVFCVAAGTRAIDRAMQAHGAMGFTNEVGLMEAWSEVRRAHVADGSNEILKRTIVNELLKV